MTTANTTNSAARALWLTTLLLSACGGEAYDSREQATPLGVSSEASTAYNLGSWSRRPMPARFCTKLDNSQSKYVLSLASYNVVRWWVIDALQATWGQVPGVTFVDNGTCLEGHLDVTVSIGAADPTLGYGDLHGLTGRGSGQTMMWALDADFSAEAEARTKAVAVHEVGHGLGLAHEHQMPGGTPCASMQFKLAGCTSCQDGSCPAADYNACFPDYPATMDPMQLDPDAKKYAIQYVHDTTPDPSARPLTSYDGLSIMDYCAGENGRDELDWLPTRLDLLGMELLYPDSRTYPLGCGTACFYAGDGIIVRTGSTVTSGWTARGAVNIHLVGGATSFPMVPGPDGNGNMTLNVVDPRGQTRVAGGQYHKSAGLYSAVVLASAVIR
jgi:hypothetical protein